MKDGLRICIDLDGTICTIKKPYETYADVKVQPGAKEFIDALKDAQLDDVIKELYD